MIEDKDIDKLYAVPDDIISRAMSYFAKLLWPRFIIRHNVSARIDSLMFCAIEMYLLIY